MNHSDHHNGRGTITEEFWVAGKDLLARIKELIAAGNVRHVIIRNESGKSLLEIPMNTGLLVGGAALFLAPFLTAIAAIAALAGKLKIEVVRDRGPGDDHQDRQDPS